MPRASAPRPSASFDGRLQAKLRQPLRAIRRARFVVPM